MHEKLVTITALGILAHRIWSFLSVLLTQERERAPYCVAFSCCNWLRVIFRVILMKFKTLLNQVNAAATTQQMVDRFDIVGIVHFGIAGNANDSMSIGDVTIPQQFAHTGIWDWLVSLVHS